MRHADLLRESTARISKLTSAPCTILQCGTWYGCVAAWACGCVFGGGMSDAIGVQKSRVNFFSTEFFDWRNSSRKSRVFRLDPPVGILSRKKLSKKCPVSTVQERPIWASFSRKRPFSTDKPDCIRNVLVSGALLRSKDFHSKLESCTKLGHHESSRSPLHQGTGEFLSRLSASHRIERPHDK